MPAPASVAQCTKEGDQDGEHATRRARRVIGRESGLMARSSSGEARRHPGPRSGHAAGRGSCARETEARQAADRFRLRAVFLTGVCRGRRGMAQWDRIDVDGSPMRLYVGMPSLGRAFPAVIVIQHGPGVDRFIEARVEPLSQQGYLAIAPDLYHRQPEDGDMMIRIGRLRDPEVISDVNAAVNYARRLKDNPPGAPGTIGSSAG